MAMTFDIAPIMVTRSPAPKSGRSAPAALARYTTDSNTPPVRPHSPTTSTGPTGVRDRVVHRSIARLDAEQPVHEAGEATPRVGVRERGLGEPVHLGHQSGSTASSSAPRF